MMIDLESEYIEGDILYTEGPWQVAVLRVRHGIEQTYPRAELYYHGKPVSACVNVRDKIAGFFPIPDKVVEKYLFWSEMTRA